MINSVGDSILIDCDLFYTVRIRFFLLKLFHVKMSKRVKESGHQFRLKKKKRAEEAASLSGSLQRFFTTQSTSSGRSVSESISDRYDQNDLALESDGEFVDEVQTLQPSPSASTDIHESTSSNQISSGINIQIYDPNTWPSVLSNVLRDQIVKSGLDKKHSSKNKKYPVSIQIYFIPHLPMKTFLNAIGFCTRILRIQFTVSFVHCLIEMKMHSVRLAVVIQIGEIFNETLQITNVI